MATMGPRQIIDHSSGIASKNADTDWLGTDLTPSFGGTAFRLHVVLATSRAIKAVDDLGNALGLYAGALLAAGQLYSIDVPAIRGRTYNIQNVGGASAITSLIIEEVF